MDNSPEDSAADISELGCWGTIDGGEWPEGTLSAESLSPWWKPSDSGNPLKVATGSLPQSLCRTCALVRDSTPRLADPYTIRTIQQLEPETCGICRILFVAYKILFRNCPTTAIPTLKASLRQSPYHRGGSLLLKIHYNTKYRSKMRTCPQILISCNIYFSFLDPLFTLRY